ncbi:MAG: RidA family protein [Pseudomonadota bacterium]
MSSTLTRMNPDTLPDAGKVGYSQMTVTAPGRLAFVSGQVAQSADGAPVPATLEGQTDQVVANLGAALEALGVGPQEIVQMRIYMTDLNDEAQTVVMSRIAAFLDGARPSLTGIGVAALAGSDLRVEVEMVVQFPT